MLHFKIFKIWQQYKGKSRQHQGAKKTVFNYQIKIKHNAKQKKKKNRIKNFTNMFMIFRSDKDDFLLWRGRLNVFQLSFARSLQQTSWSFVCITEKRRSLGNRVEIFSKLEIPLSSRQLEKAADCNTDYSKYDICIISRISQSQIFILISTGC